MSHEIEMVNGVAQMAYVGEVPWHGLGKRVDENISSEEMLKEAGLNWKVRELSTFAEMKVDGKTKRLSTGMKALVRETDGRILTQVGKKWNPVQNEDAFDFFKEFVDAGQMKMHTAGSLKNGQMVWALAKVEDDFDVFGGDKVESYLLFSNPHMYGKTIDVRFTPIRVVCNNTLTLSLDMNAKTSAKINHRHKFNADEVKEILGIAKFKMSQYKEMAEFLGSKQVNKSVMEQYFGELIGRDKENGLTRTGNMMMDLIESQPGAEYAKGSFWSMYNAVTYATDHILGRENDTRLYSAWYGSNSKLKTKALELAIDMAA